MRGRIIKLSPQGDSIWNREYEYLTTAGARNQIYDAASTPDGGFLICGQSTGSGSGASQQGWLLKLDEHGCLVPGCHTPLVVLPFSAKGLISLSVYPNPTSDYLNIHYQSLETGVELTFSILDMQGRVIRRYESSDIADKTYILPTFDLMTGLYILEVFRDGDLVATEKFIKK